MTEQLLTVADVAARWQVHPKTVEVMCRTGELKAFKLSTSRTASWRIDPRDLARFEQQRRVA